MARKMTKRQRTAAARRAAIMSTVEFQTWWAARRHIHPIPSDPFRAFMIDRGLVARLLDKETWKPRTNRTDLVPVDNYQRAGRKQPRRRYRPHRFRAGYLPVPARPIGKLTKEEKEIKALVAKMAEHYHVPEPDIFFERKQGEAIGSMHHGGFGGIKPFMRLGVRDLKKQLPKAKAVAAHEMGHHVHKRGAESILGSLNIRGYGEAMTKEKEKIAWKIADPFLTDQRAVQKWVKKMYLGTYLGTTPRRR